jgi:hypothetical protein
MLELTMPSDLEIVMTRTFEAKRIVHGSWRGCVGTSG